MAGESVNENIYLAITFGYGGQKRFQKLPLAIAERYPFRKPSPPYSHTSSPAIHFLPPDDGS